MLTFFRRIRKGLLGSGQTRKPASPIGRYLLYAIGEIVLVVLGILIALQINNWNEYRKERIIEKELLVGLYESVINNQNNLSDGLESWSSTSRAIEILTNAMDNNLPYADSLNYHFKEAHRSRGNNLNRLDFSGYKALENSGYEILRNKSLRKSIISLFESNLPGLETTSAQVDFENSGFHSEYIVRNFVVEGPGESPIDYSSVMKDRYYYSILRRLNYNLSRKISRVQRTLRTIDENRKLLEKELDQFSY